MNHLVLADDLVDLHLAHVDHHEHGVIAHRCDGLRMLLAKRSANDQQGFNVEMPTLGRLSLEDLGMASDSAHLAALLRLADLRLVAGFLGPALVVIVYPLLGLAAGVPR